MTQDEIIEMAQECKLIGMRPFIDGIYTEALIEFAKLVAAKAIAELESQEPVAWIHNFIEGGISIGKQPSDLDRHPDRWTALYKDSKPCPTCEALARTVMLDQTSHDTTPPQRTWVGLTRDEQSFVYQRLHNATSRIDSFWVDFANAIEAKLKEKNT
jgi:hypothetical protein